MKRIGATVSVLAVLLLLDAPTVGAAGGGQPQNFNITTLNPAITAVILIDPHMSGVTTTAKKAFVSLRNGTITTQATFDILPDFQLFRGCDLTLTNTRFLFSSLNETSLRNWVPPLPLETLFVPFGITLDLSQLPFLRPGLGFTQTTPVITSINSSQCIPDPNNPGPIQNGGDGASSIPGWLLINATIQFAVPK